MADASYKKLNYSTRIGKSIERKMFCDVFRKLSVFQKLQQYRYIGFGSTFFSDFSLFHKQLAVTNMISIERQIIDKDRFVFNKPYSCIDIIFDESNNVLPSLDWEPKTILWLDYDGHLTLDSLHDVSTFFANAQSGSFFVITVNAHADTLKVNAENVDDGDAATVQSPAEIRSFREQKVIERITASKMPHGLNNASFSLKKFPDIYHQVILNEINDTIVSRNRTLPTDRRLAFAQILNIEYQDNAKMLSIGGLLYAKNDAELLMKANFKEFDFYRPSLENRYKIEVPSLTFKEIRYLDTMLPSLINANGALKYGRKNIACIPKEDVIKYKKLYKYFPTFAEAIV